MRYAIFAMLILSASLANAETYMWEDKQGTVHFTDNINEVPKKQRAKVVIQGEMKMSDESRAYLQQKKRQQAVEDYNESIERANREQVQRDQQRKLRELEARNKAAETQRQVDEARAMQQQLIQDRIYVAPTTMDDVNRKLDDIDWKLRNLR